MDVTIYFNDQPCLVTVKVNNKTCNDLLSPKMDAQLIRTQFLPKDFLGGSHLTAQFAGTLKFFFGDGLTWDDVFDWHDWLILPLSRLP